ncbi:hypothetical protein [Phreatobacter sp.]|uniref:hypothetical protein n=1 Tax=Phreatobacter sp. TaxID=1966341 RepID=UPI0022C2C832|nr:hypothetical protein [Phreatobacter sp.]MCZ8314500.1 hypothetical protein [Phreatobacter sp.]
MRRALLLAAVLLASGPAVAAETCDGDLAVMEIRLREASARLSETTRAPMARRCPVFRDHVRVMQAASDTFRRCTSGFHARENIAQIQGSIADWNEIIDRNCR